MDHSKKVSRIQANIHVHSLEASAIHNRMDRRVFLIEYFSFFTV